MKNNHGVGEMIKLGLTLVCYAVISCTVLAIVNNFTAPKIKQNQIDAANKAMREVFATADEFIPVENYSPSSVNTITVSDVYLAKQGGHVVGGVAQVSGPTYDKGKLIVGMDIDGVVTGMRILELSDSPGFGLKANDPTFKLPNGKTFYEQFAGKSALTGFNDGKNFDAISGATISSKGLGNLVDQGTSVLLKYFDDNKEALK